MADISQIKLPDNTTYDINAKKVNSHTVATDVPSGAVFTDTKNTAGSTDTSSKIYLVGATEQSANPQTYSDDQVYTQNGTLNVKNMYARNDNGQTVVALQIDSRDGGQFNVFNSAGIPRVYCTSNLGQICANQLIAINKASGNKKAKIRHKVNEDYDYGESWWYGNDESIRLVIKGDDDTFNLQNSSNAPRVNLSIDSYDHGTIYLFNEDGAARVYAYGSGEVYSQTYLAMDSDDNINAKIEGGTGLVTCTSMNYTDISSLYRTNKSSGALGAATVEAYRSGNMIQMKLTFAKNTTSSQSVGTNIWVGNLTNGPMPITEIKLVGYYASSVLLCNISTTGSVNLRVLGAASQFTSSCSVSGTFMTDSIPVEGLA